MFVASCVPLAHELIVTQTNIQAFLNFTELATNETTSKGTSEFCLRGLRINIIMWNDKYLFENKYIMIVMKIESIFLFFIIN